MKKIIISIVLFLTFLNTNAQCAMCKAVIESGGDTSQAEGLNTGILYLMVFPYLLVGVLLYFIFKYRRKFKL
jgi:heme/copper-type cytochrome/quinol oxidase subunit 2